MDTLNFVTVPTIVAAVYSGITLLKKAVKCKEKIMRLLPLIAAIFGAVLGIIAFFSVPDIIPASDVFTAILVGGASGLAATGTNQIIKQLTKDTESRR
jgi:prepilin signal peptidase PulO-like enzyme (type II secretory pathway)